MPPALLKGGSSDSKVPPKAREGVARNAVFVKESGCDLKKLNYLGK